jgi:23S rRNA (uridine2552-2'-O)-methyltransferase
VSNYNRKDHLYRKAKEEGYRSRAAYKLAELNDKLKFLRPGAKVLELGCFPGGWLQVAAEKVGPKGLVVGVDLRPIQPFRRGEFPKGLSIRPPKSVEGDVREPETMAKLKALGPFDVVLSDMAPQLTGIPARDTARIAELFELALESASALLKRGGIFVAKEFPSQEIDETFRRFRGEYEKLDRTRLKSTRTTSNELYVVGRGFRGKSESVK